MPSQKYSVFQPAKPYFDLVRSALGDLVDGEHFFDIVTDDTVYVISPDDPPAWWPCGVEVEYCDSNLPLFLLAGVCEE